MSKEIRNPNPENARRLAAEYATCAETASLGLAPSACFAYSAVALLTGLTRGSSLPNSALGFVSDFVPPCGRISDFRLPSPSSRCCLSEQPAPDRRRLAALRPGKQQPSPLHARQIPHSDQRLAQPGPGFVQSPRQSKGPPMPFRQPPPFRPNGLQLHLEQSAQWPGRRPFEDPRHEL